MPTHFFASTKTAPLPAKPKRQYRRGGTEHIEPRQADELVEAARFARERGWPLYCHATVHWANTAAGDDKDGSRGAKVREGFRKFLGRKKIPLCADWVREAPSGVGHFHMAFYLPDKWLRDVDRLAEIERGLKRLVTLHGDGEADGYAVKFERRNGDPRYFLKGGTPEVWSKHKVKIDFRNKPQGVIFGKRSGSTLNIGPKAREIDLRTA